MHGCTGLRQKVLDDDLLDVAMSSMRRSDGLQGGDPIAPVLANSDQNPGGEWDGELSCRLQGGQPAGRHLVRCTTVAVQVLNEVLYHHPLRWRDPPEGS